VSEHPLILLQQVLKYTGRPTLDGACASLLVRDKYLLIPVIPSIFSSHTRQACFFLRSYRNFGANLHFCSEPARSFHQEQHNGLTGGRLGQLWTFYNRNHHRPSRSVPRSSSCSDCDNPATSSQGSNTSTSTARTRTCADQYRVANYHKPCDRYQLCRKCYQVSPKIERGRASESG
jgi:hypothetical protein